MLSATLDLAVTEFKESKEFRAFSSCHYDEGMIEFIKSAWEEHPEWDDFPWQRCGAQTYLTILEAEHEARE